MLKNLQKNEKGVVLITVLMILIIMMSIGVQIVAMTVTRNMSEVKTARQIQAELLAQGMLALIYSNHLSSTPGDYFESSYTLDGVTFNTTAAVSSVDNGIYNSYPVQINVYY